MLSRSERRLYFSGVPSASQGQYSTRGASLEINQCFVARRCVCWLRRAAVVNLPLGWTLLTVASLEQTVVTSAATPIWQTDGDEVHGIEAAHRLFVLAGRNLSPSRGIPQMFDRIVSTPAILGGKPVIKGTRISVFGRTMRARCAHLRLTASRRRLRGIRVKCGFAVGRSRLRLCRRTQSPSACR